jgi:hypothetical protein|tara:strand:- start:297 stop:779 length:483 start_codon:yes stop_codon:yes gene_type:complete
MAYIRVKKIKDREYAYLVKTKWIKAKKQPKQSVSKYLGRVVSYEDPVSVDYWSFVGKDVGTYMTNLSKASLIGDLVKWEFKKHGVEKVSFGKHSVKMGKKDVTLRMNEGFLNGHTLKELIEYKQPRGTEDGFDLAKRFIGAGIMIPQDLFIEVFSRKLFK